MDLQAEAVTGAVAELLAEAGRGYRLSDDPVEFPAVEILAQGVSAGFLRLIKQVVNFLHFRFRLFKEESAGLVAVIALVAGTEIYSHNITGADPASGCDSMRQS